MKNVFNEIYIKISVGIQICLLLLLIGWDVSFIDTHAELLAKPKIAQALSAIPMAIMITNMFVLTMILVFAQIDALRVINKVKQKDDYKQANNGLWAIVTIVVLANIFFATPDIWMYSLLLGHCISIILVLYFIIQLRTNSLESDADVIKKVPSDEGT